MALHRGNIESRWNISTDTGGTFTDCIATSPSGDVHRTKVLSGGGLRCRVIDRPNTNDVVIDTDWNMQRDLLRGGVVLMAGDDAPIAEIIAFDRTQRTLTLNNSGPADRISIGDCLEIRSANLDEPAPVLAARLVTQTPFNQPLPPTAFRLATTRGTNALLERATVPTLLCVTRGFGDVLRIRDQTRPKLFDLDARRPPPITECVVEIDERLDADGLVKTPIDLELFEHEAREWWRKGMRVAAVSLLHAYRNPQHEQKAEQVLRMIGFDVVRVSSTVVPLIKHLPRTETTVIDAALTPIVNAYFESVRATLEQGSLHAMTSAGGLVHDAEYKACESLLSGPAGGVRGAAAIAAQEGCPRVIALDMGGTSSDVSRIDGDADYVFQHSVGDATVVRPACAIESVAAGGGSICEVIDGRMRVGPRSAGAVPGPACYGAGGPLTITDVNLLAGRIDPAGFSIPVDDDAAERAFDAVVDAWRSSCSVDGEPAVANHTREAVLDALLDLANQHMAAGIERVSIARGYDPRDHALVAFGGAGGQHACAVADRLGMTTILLPLDASILSAVGVHHASNERIAEQQVLAPLTEFASVASEHLGRLEAAAREALREDVDENEMQPVTIRRRIASLRLMGQESTIEVEVEVEGNVDAPDGVSRNELIRESIERRFRDRYAELYGRPPQDRPIEVESIRVIAEVASQRRLINETPSEPSEHLKSSGTRDETLRRMRSGRRWVQVRTIDWQAMEVNEIIDGPCVIAGRDSSFIVDDGWTVHRTTAGACRLQRDRQLNDAASVQSAAATELFAQRLSSIADDMGEVLKRTSLSTNVKEREDFSCAVLDRNGRLIVNAPHIPVHLGAMGACVRAIPSNIELKPGDMVVTNHPGFGGSHLPDVTVIAPIFDELGTIQAYVANRAHHAEIGGTRPGSMPPDARHLIEEGVIIEPRHIVRQGEPCLDEIRLLLTTAKHPSRSPDENCADLAAQIASNLHGVRTINALIETLGTEQFNQHVDALSNHARRVTADVLAPLVGTSCVANDALDDGTPLSVAVRAECDQHGQPRVCFDFTGTGAQHPGNLNATPAIVTAVVLYVLRVMRGDRLPLNEAALDAVDIILPDHSLVCPDFSGSPDELPAVVGGNVETSQRLVNLALRALNLAAESQGTMNNILFGNERFGYYETVAGGGGAGDGFPGAHAVQSHMTNTLMTDAEILEHRYPVRVRAFRVRKDSGGKGIWPGGDGVVRELEFLEPVELSVVTQRRTAGPRGIHGGADGTPGRQSVVRKSGRVEQLGAVDGCALDPGDRLVLETPGGAACGQASATSADSRIEQTPDGP